MSNLPSAPSPSLAATDVEAPIEARPRVLSHAEVERLFREHHDALIRFLAARLRSVEEATEVAQEAYVRLMHLHDPSACSFLKALLYRTATNLAIDRIRQRQRRSQLDQEALPQFAAQLSTPAPDRLWVAREELVVIQESLHELPARCREVFLMARIDDVSVEDIAQQMSISVRSVWRYIARAMEHIQLRLDQAGAAKHAVRRLSVPSTMERRPRR